MRQIPNTENRKPKTEHRSFTLIEILVVFSILTVIIGIAFTAIRLNETYRDLTFIRIQLYRQNKRAHDAIAEELEKSQIGKAFIADTNPDKIIFQIPLLNSTTYNISWGARWDNTDYIGGYIWYRLNGTNLVREVVDYDEVLLLETQQIIATDIIDLQFSNVTANCTNCISISTTARKTTLPPQRNMTDSLNSTVYLLN